MLVCEILVPIETVSEVKNGKKKQIQKVLPRLCFCGDETFDQVGNLKKKPWYKIKETDGVINFNGRENPTPLADDEIDEYLNKL